MARKSKLPISDLKKNPPSYTIFPSLVEDIYNEIEHFQSSAIRSESSGLLASSICIPSGDGDLKIIQLFLEIRESKKLILDKQK